MKEYFTAMFTTYNWFFIPYFAAVIAIIMVVLIGSFAKRTIQKGSLNVGKIVDDIRYLKAGNLTLRIKAQCVGKKPLEEKIQKLIEREITK